MDSVNTSATPEKGPSLAVVIPHRGADKYRIRNVYFVIRYLRRFVPDLQIVISEMDDGGETNFSGFLGNGIARVMTYEGGPFNRGRACNKGAECVTADWILFLDNDSFPEPENMRAIIDALGSHVAAVNGCFWPFDEIRMLNAWETEQCILHDSFSGCGTLRGNGKTFPGHAVCVRRDVFEQIGGWDELPGWGPEDSLFRDRLEARIGVRGTLPRLPGRIYHLWHPPAGTSEHIESPDFARVKEMADRLRKEIKKKFLEKMRSLIQENREEEAARKNGG